MPEDCEDQTEVGDATVDVLVDVGDEDGVLSLIVVVLW